MSPELPFPIADFVEANARLDLDGMLKPFAAEAVFLDNGERFTGQEDIRTHLKTMVVDLKAVFTPDTVRHEDDVVVMEGPAHGDYPGSPIRFTYRVELDGDVINTMDVSA